jgi:predicted glycosyltransferase
MITFETWLGAGHAAVASNASRTLRKRGMGVTVATSSGEIAANFNFGEGTKRLDLARWTLLGPPESKTLEVEGQVFTGLDGKVVQQALSDLAAQKALSGDEPWHGPLSRVFEARQIALRTAARKVNALVTEFWPLGGLALVNPEMEALLGGPDRPPTVIALERDIVFPGADAAERVARVNRYIDQVAVRGDPKVASLEASNPVTRDINKPIEYLGFFGDPMPPRRAMPEVERPVLVTCGGGARPQDIKLFEAAIKSAEKSPLSDHPWRVFIPVGTAPGVVAHLKALAAESPVDISIEPNVKSEEFRQLLADCALVFTQAGYNTANDIALGGVRAIFIPVGGKDSEQHARAAAMCNLSGSAMVSQNDAEDISKLSAAIEDVCKSEPKPIALPIDGADRLADVIQRTASSRKARRRERARREHNDEPQTIFRPHEIRRS